MSDAVDQQWGDEQEGTVCVQLAADDDPWGPAEDAAWKWLTESDGLPVVIEDPVVVEAGLPVSTEPPMAIAISRTKTPVVALEDYQVYIAATRPISKPTRPIPAAVTAALLVPSRRHT